MNFNTNSDYQNSINAIGQAQGLVTDKLGELQNAKTTDERLKISMELMEAQQKLTILSEGFTKTMKAHTDAQKAAITNAA